MLDTTIAGSLPKPEWLAEPEKLWAPWRLEGESLEYGKRDAAALEFVDPARMLPCTNCGMAPLPRYVALGKLQGLAAGTALVRKKLFPVLAETCRPD